MSSPVPGPPLVAQVLAPGVALLGDEGVDLAMKAVLLMVHRNRLNGIEPSPAVRVLLAALADAGTGSGTAARGAQALNGTSEPDLTGVSAVWLEEDAANVEEVAQVLEVSEGYARRLLRGRTFQTRRKAPDGSWRVDRLELHQRRQDRQETRTS